MNNDNTEMSPRIALTFSGGGFRASSFCLGALTYLDRIKISGESLLNHCIVLSTVSGGTITGARYAEGIARGETMIDIYNALYRFMSKTDIVRLALDRLTTDNGWEPSRLRTLINSFADVYDEELFKQRTFASLLKDPPPTHFRHISFNATEFSNGVQFRFQWSEKINNPIGNERERGIIGNKYFEIPPDAAAEIRMADIVAASSCFPAGFEPINFPTDFIHRDSTTLEKLASHKNYPIGLMDGGIVDNQGIDPVILAEARLKRNRPEGSTKKDNDLDLIVSCDVASPFLEAFIASIENKKSGWRSLTPAFILVTNTVILAITAVLLAYAIEKSIIWLTILSTAVVTMSLILYVVGIVLRSLPKKLGVPSSFLKPLAKLLKIKLRTYENMLFNRVNSVLKMTVGVFLKHIRGLNYDKVYDAPEWTNRTIMNAVYELQCFNGKLNDKIRAGHLPSNLMPSAEMQKVASAAASMGTTLWFSAEELKSNMLNNLIATGHFTICWNLLEYITKLKADPRNTNYGHEKIKSLEPELLKDWERFNSDPLFFVNELNSRMKQSELRNEVLTKKES